MNSILRSMSSRRLSAELVDCAAALCFGQTFERGDIEFCLDLIRGNSVLSGEVEEVLDLLGRSGSIRGRTVFLVVGKPVAIVMGRAMSQIIQGNLIRTLFSETEILTQYGDNHETLFYFFDSNTCAILCICFVRSRQSL